MKARGEKIAALTAYDYPMARLLDECGVPLLLVGDSVGMVVLGYPDTTHVTLAEMLHHTRAVARARTSALVGADLPFKSYETPESAVANARQLAPFWRRAFRSAGIWACCRSMCWRRAVTISKAGRKPSIRR